jgi:hypothetical protein
MNFSELQVVRTLRDATDMDGVHVPAGSIGTIVHIYNNTRYCVEFTTPQALADYQVFDLVLASAAFCLDIRVEANDSGSATLHVEGYDQRDIVSIFAKLDDWCASQWQGRKWHRNNNRYTVETQALAFEFRMRWHGVDFYGLFTQQ